MGLAAGAAPAAGSPLAGVLGGQQAARPKAVLIFVSARPAGSGEPAELRALAASAGSWLQLPNAVHQVCGRCLRGLGAGRGQEKQQLLL